MNLAGQTVGIIVLTEVVLSPAPDCEHYKPDDHNDSDHSDDPACGASLRIRLPSRRPTVPATHLSPMPEFSHLYLFG
jgi:hypothetical protein